MALSKFSSILVVAVSIVALCLFLLLIALLLFWLIQKWRERNSTWQRYRKLNSQKQNEQFVVPKIPTNFPTAQFTMQYYDSPSHSSDEEFKRRFSDDEENKRQSPNRSPPRRKSGIAEPKERRRSSIFGKESVALYLLQRHRRVMSEPDIFRAQSEQEATTTSLRDMVKLASDKHERRGSRRKKSSSRSGLKALIEISGQIEYTIFHDSRNEKLVFEVVQVLDIQEITTDLFMDRCEIVDLENLTLGTPGPCLVRDKNGAISFSNMSELGLYVELTMFPKKKRIGKTTFKQESDNMTFNEKFVLEQRKIEDLYGSMVRFQVLLKYGKQQQEPVIIGETIAPMKNMKSDAITSFTDELKMPVDEEDLVTSLGQLEVSVRYQLLRQVLTIRIENAIGLPRMGIHGLPNSSVKVIVYLNDVAIKKRTTEIVKKTCQPIFKKSFDVDVSQNELHEVGILLQVRLHGAMYKSVLGYVHIGPAAEGQGEEHWNEVLSFMDFNSPNVFDIMSKKPSTLCLPS
eukprot:gene10033-11058_t